ncbi:MAG: SusC/RagA family TonB-linked outer membrane protein [Williamsia sp.]|nr:SusC/RagA family TonB-linked outer membrane protein [Williamsia sp.]
MKVLFIFGLLLVFTSRLSAQARLVSGQVTSAEDGKPLPAVSVQVKGRSAGTQTKEDGSFSLSAVNGDILVFTMTGFASRQVTIRGLLPVNVSMKGEAGKLGEVVVVGYGSQSRRNITSSIAKLDTSVLQNAPRANVGSALQGTVSGLQVVTPSGAPGTSPIVLLRGGASINNPGAPLVVVDGVIRDYNDIAAEDIASMELLKDAASTAIYGARANNGVILITTRQGRAGTAQISYKFTGGANINRKGYRYMSAKDYIYFNRLGNLNSGRTLANVNASRGYGLLTDAANLASFDIRSYDAATAPLLQKGWDTVGDPYGGTIIFKDHGGEIEKILFRNTHTQDHYLNVSAGNDKGRYFASFDYYKEDGVIVGSSYKRFSGDVNGSYRVKPNVEVGTGVNLSTASQYGTIGGDVNTLYRNLSIWPTFNPWLDSAKTLPNPGNGITDGNPLYWLNRVQRNNQLSKVTVVSSLKWDILPGLYIKATANAYLYENVSQSFNQATQNYTNLFANPPSYSSTSRDAVNYFRRDFQQTYNAIANYTHQFGGAHNINAMLGAEYFDYRRMDMQVYGTNAPTNDISTPNASTTFAAGNNYGTRSQYRIVSHFGRINYDFNQKYLLTGVYRQDGISRLAAGNRWGFFPGGSAGWNMHREAFYQDWGLDKVLSSLKPRISYGVNGNVAGLGDYEVQGVYGLQTNYSGNAGFLNTSLVNSNLRWEKSKTTDVGFDAGLLNNRITLIFDYYDRKTSDLLTNLTLPSYIGFNTVRTNLGTFQNKGWELTLQASVLNRADGLRWDIGANASYVKNKILQLPYNGNERNRQGGLQIYDPAAGKVVWVGGLQEGQSLGSIYAFRQVSIFKDAAEIAKLAGSRVDVIGGISGPNSNYGTGKITPGDVNWMDVDKNDTIDSRDMVYMGNIYPKWTGGFNTSLSYKGLSLYSRFEFALGHTIYNDQVARVLGNYQGTFNYIELQKEAWSPSNTQTDIPKVYYADQVAAPAGKKNYTRNNNAGGVLNGNNSRFYEKGDYLACREITLSCDLSKKLHARLPFLSQARIYATVMNLFYITQFSGPSPEPPVAAGSSTINGIYAGTYPTPKTIVAGIQVSF